VQIKQFDRVLLKDGREGSITDVLGNNEMYYLDVGSSPDDWVNITVKPDDIERVILDNIHPQRRPKPKHF